MTRSTALAATRPSRTRAASDAAKSEVPSREKSKRSRTHTDECPRLAPCAISYMRPNTPHAPRAALLYDVLSPFRTLRCPIRSWINWSCHFKRAVCRRKTHTHKMCSTYF